VTKLSININKIATLRNARGGSLPDPITCAIDLQCFGAEGITVHPRPDERHIRYADVYALKPVVKTEFNIEGYPSDDFIKMVKEIKPAQVTLVPDPPGVLTSNAGWDTRINQNFLKKVVEDFKASSIRVSLFIDPDKEMIRFAKETGTDRIELYTEVYASGYSIDPELAIKPYTEAAIYAHEIGLGLNAGHDLNLQNLRYFKQNIPQLLEVSIGHAFVVDALYFGFEKTIQLYLEELKG